MILEQEPENMETINEIFRAAHALKGMAGTMGYKRMQRLTHDMENVFQEIRSGNMKVPSMLGVTMCALDVIFNFLLIFPSHHLEFGSMSLTIPGAGLGVKGAALGTAAAETVVAAILIWYLSARSTDLKLTGEHGRFLPRRETIRKALNIGLPMGVEHVLICGAQILTTVIVAPLGVFAIAANSFAITAESLCICPVWDCRCCTTLVGQSIGADRRKLVRSFARITIFIWYDRYGVIGVLMYLFAPNYRLDAPVGEIRELGIMALRIEAFAEPIVCQPRLSLTVSLSEQRIRLSRA